MVIDTSAVVAILTNEDDAEQFENAIDRDTARLMSAASVLEAAWFSKAGTERQVLANWI
jgi:ribonuclease VapC